ncbi:MAG TPA: hypothetical protein VFC21_05900, partial [Bryobacteraceae bacterium]|nr:hypothetical protein [Bryobacteraceae bacterium]
MERNRCREPERLRSFHLAVCLQHGGDQTSIGGTFVQILRATSTNVYACQPAYSNYLAVQIDTTTYPGPYTLSVLNGSTQLAATQVALNPAGSTLRSVIYGSTLLIYINGYLIGNYTVPASTGSYAGFAWCYMTTDDNGNFNNAGGWAVGHHDTIAPNPIGGNIPHTAYSSDVSFKWSPTTDDTNGIGLFSYQLYRDGAQIGTWWPGGSPPFQYTDFSAAPGSTHTYAISAVDFHGNTSTPTSFTLTSPPANFPDPRRTGVRASASYWGGNGEQIDTLSGNLNFTLPLLNATGRNGWTVPVGLVYNSQNWRQDSGVNWQLGFDVGFGFGWKMLIGSVTPYYAQVNSGVDHYIYTDATGAEYRLDQNNSGIWSSQQGIYVWFDATANILHFKDGTFWAMGCTSGGLEPDAGTLYPTVIEDVSGNQVTIAYDSGNGAFAANTSARITTITDVRGYVTTCPSQPFNGTYVPCVNPAYGFTYAGSPVKHLSRVGGINISFTMVYSSVALSPPFGSDPNYAGWTTTQLTGMTPAGLPPYSFSYDSAGASELTGAIFPYGGEMNWAYGTFAYSGGRLLREIGGRSLAPDAYHSSTPWTYTITRPDPPNSVTSHSGVTLSDASGVGAKTWNFFTSGSAWQIGLASEFLQKASASGSVYTDETYTWSQDPAGNPYISTKITVADPAGTNPQTAKTTQTLDQ